MQRDGKRVMFVQYTAIPSGSPTSGLMIAQGFREAGWRADAMFGDSGSMLADYASIGCTVRVVPHGQWLVGGSAQRKLRRWGRDLRSAWEFRRLMGQSRPDLVYINTLTGLAPAVAAWALGIPCVWHLRELFDDAGGEAHDPLGGRRMVRWVLRRMARRVVAISRAVQENVLGRAADGPAVAIIPNAVAPEFFTDTSAPEECRQRLGLPVGLPIVGVPGTLRPVKGHPFFLETAARIAHLVPACQFAISGDGAAPYRQQLEAQAQELGIAERVRFLGTLADMRAFYRACDVVCVPSVAEPFGRTVIEAFACGAPVVATRVGGMVDTVDDGETGFLVPYGDREALADRLVRLLGDHQLRQDVARTARLKAEAYYREDAYRRRVLDVAEQAMQPVESRQIS